MKNSILDNIQTEKTWLDVETVAKLKGISKRGVRLAINNYEHKVENTRGGKTYKIRLSSLEEELQIKYIQEYYNDFKSDGNEIIELNNLKIKQEKLISEEQKKQALAKYDIIKLWLEFRKNLRADKKKNIIDPSFKNVRSDKQFEILFNTGTLYPELFNTVGKISVGSLYRWHRLLGYNGDWTCLVGQYKYSTRKEYRTTLNEEQIKIFIQILLSPSAFSIGKSISLTKHILKERGYEILPKDVTFRRYAYWFRDNNFDKWTLARDGEKALKDKVSPYIVRNASLLKAGQVLIADGHTLNFQVLNPFTGKPCRATLLGFLDWKSGGLVGYDIMLEECTQNIASALRKGKRDKEPLFKSLWGRRYNRITAYYMIREACKNVGLEEKIGTHSMRKTFGYHHYQQFKDVALLQKIFNHSSQQITLRYIGIEQDQIDYSYNNFIL